MSILDVGPEEYRFEDEHDRIDERLDELAEEAADADEDAPALDSLTDEAARLERQLNDLERLIDEYGGDTTVTVKGLTAGDYARVQDDVADGGGPGAKRNLTVAEGLVNAPFFETEDPSRNTKIMTVAGLPIGALLWLEDRIEELTRGDEGNSDSFAERVQAKQGD